MKTKTTRRNFLLGATALTLGGLCAARVPAAPPAGAMRLTGYSFEEHVLAMELVDTDLDDGDTVHFRCRIDESEIPAVDFRIDAVRLHDDTWQKVRSDSRPVRLVKSTNSFVVGHG